MTDEEKSEDYIVNMLTEKGLAFSQYGITERLLKQAYLDGLTEGRKEVREHETTCINRLHFIEKENEELKAQLEKPRCENAYLTIDKCHALVPCYTVYNCRNCFRREPAE